MRLVWKWLLASIGGGVLVTVFLLAFADRWVVDVPGPQATADRALARCR
jgi:hypothetical protein